MVFGAFRRPCKEPNDSCKKLEEKTPSTEHHAAEKCLSCLSSTPCPALLSWIALLLGLGGFAGGIVYGIQKSREIFDDMQLLWFGELTIIGVTIAMFVFGTFFLVLCHISSEPTSRHVFNSSAKNACARGLNMAVIIVNYCLIVAWVLLFSLLSLPIVGLIIMIFVHDKRDGCLDLKAYAISNKKVCEMEIDVFQITGKDALVSYAVAYGSTLLVIFSLVSFLVCLTANFTHLKDSRFATLNAYENDDVMLSKHSILETTM